MNALRTLGHAGNVPRARVIESLLSQRGLAVKREIMLRAVSMQLLSALSQYLGVWLGDTDTSLFPVASPDAGRHSWRARWLLTKDVARGCSAS